jgi:hypothetical protein
VKPKNSPSDSYQLPACDARRAERGIWVLVLLYDVVCDEQQEQQQEHNDEKRVVS